jgi:hypothetical protein
MLLAVWPPIGFWRSARSGVTDGPLDVTSRYENGTMARVRRDKWLRAEAAGDAGIAL